LSVISLEKVKKRGFLNILVILLEIIMLELLNQEQILKLSEEELNDYLQKIKKYKDFIKEEIIWKREILHKIISKELFENKIGLSERNNNIIEELKKML
jgi:hypothetical protein